MLDLHETFEKFDKEFCEFERIDNPPNKRRDLCAMIMMDRLVPGSARILESAEHDEVYFSIDTSELAEVATENDIRDLIRCGVRIGSDYAGLCMFV